MRLRLRLALVTAAVSAPFILGLVWWDARSQQRAAAAELMEHARGLAEWPGWVARCEADPASWRGGGPGGSEGPGRRDGPGGRDGPGHGGPPPRGERGEGERPGPGQPPPGPQGPPPGAEDRGAGWPPPPPEGARRGPPPGPRSSELRYPRHRRPAEFFAYGAALTSPNPAAPRLPEEERRELLAELAERDALQLEMPWRSGTVRVLIRVPGESEACAFVLAQGTTEPWLGGILPPTHLWLLPLLAVIGVVLLAVGPVVRRLRRLTAAAQRSERSDYQSGVELDGGDEIAELARTLDGAARRVREQLAETHQREQALREFVANTTHDIMIPLTVLQGHLARLAADGAAAPSSSTAPTASAASGGEPEPLRSSEPRVLGAAMDEAHYLGALIHNLAMAAKLDTAAPAPLRARVDLNALVERVVMRHRTIARSLEVALDHAVPAEPLTTPGDVTMLEQAATNLVYNAIRHNRRGGHVAVILEAAEAGFALRVIDDGPGVPDAELGRLAERGFRGEAARTRTPEGRGLGLDIARRVAALHGLALRFSRPEEGGLVAELVTDEPAPPLTPRGSPSESPG